MQDDVERVREAMAATREIDAEALRELPAMEAISPKHVRSRGPAQIADWLQQRANDVKEAGNG